MLQCVRQGHESGADLGCLSIAVTGGIHLAALHGIFFSAFKICTPWQVCVHLHISPSIWAIRLYHWSSESFRT